MESMDFHEIDSRKTTIKTAYSKTCKWFLKHPDYLMWTNPQAISKHHGFLWIRGKPGAGKSTIMKFLYLEAKRQDCNLRSVTASFFFNARGGDLEKTVSGMYRSLLLQLFKGFPDLQCVLDDPDLVPQGQTGCPSLNVLKNLLRSAISKLDQRSFTCFVDALDECDEQQVMDLVESFEDIAEQCTEDGIRLQICFSSRHYPYIDVRLGLRLILEEQVGHVGDLETYIKTHLRVRDPLLLADLQARILDKAAGVFLWVVLVVDVLNKENRRGRLFLKTRLEEVPSGLSNLFKDLLRRDNSNMEELRMSLLWILLSKRPLKPEEYYHGLWSGLSSEGLADLDPPETTTIDADDCFNRCVISSSKGLAEITKSKHPTVQFIHESVRDFLIKDRGLHELWPELGTDWESVGHERLKICCDSYLELCTSNEDARRLLAESRTRKDDVKTYTLLEYASQFVFYHAEYAAKSICQKDFLHSFQLSGWIRAFNHFEKFKVRRYTKNATLIYILAERGYPLLIREILKSDPDVETPIKGERYRYPLIAAMAKGNKDSVAALLDLPSTVHDGVDITESLVGNIDAGGAGRSPFSWACENGHLGIAKVLVQRGAQKHENDKNVWTPLMLASMNGKTDIVQLLIDDGGHVNATFKYETAISLASARGHAKVVKILLDAGASLDYRNAQGESLLCLAARGGYERTVAVLLERGVPVNKAADDGMQPLHFATRNGRSEPIMEMLLKCGADINSRNRNGNTCLHLSMIAQSYEISELLLRNGADVNARNRRGETCLHWLSTGTNHVFFPKRLFKLLSGHGVDINARDIHGDTLLHQMCTGSDGLTYFVRRSGLDLNAQNKNGETPLHVASQRGYKRAIVSLIERGAEINCRDNQGNTPLDKAISGKEHSTCQLLVENGGIRSTT